MAKDITTFWFRPCDRQMGRFARMPFLSFKKARKSCDACFAATDPDKVCNLRNGRIRAYHLGEEQP